MTPAAAAAWTIRNRRSIAVVVLSVALSPVLAIAFLRYWDSDAAIGAAALVYLLMPMLLWGLVMRPRTSVTGLLALYLAWALNLVLGVGLLVLILSQLDGT